MGSIMNFLYWILQDAYVLIYSAIMKNISLWRILIYVAKSTYMAFYNKTSGVFSLCIVFL